jgi:putative DNA primase/helicase
MKISDNLALKTQPAFLELYKSIFQGRQDVVPELWVSMDGRKGYAPICKNNRVSNKCAILKGINSPCKTCINKEYVPLTDELLQEHLDGKRVLGVYPLLPGNICYFLAGDFDNHTGDKDPLIDVKAYHQTCSAHQIPCYVFRSRSGAGYHAYIFFQEPVQVWKARLVAFHLLKQAGVIGSEQQLSSFDRLFPNQDQLAGNKIGNLIAMPFQGEAVKKGNTVFLDPASGFAAPYTDQITILGEISYVSEADLDRIIKQQGLNQATPKPTLSAISSNNSSTQNERILECDFIRWCKENQNLVVV